MQIPSLETSVACLRVFMHKVYPPHGIAIDAYWAPSILAELRNAIGGTVDTRTL